MRKVSLKNLTLDMQLARPVYNQNSLLLNRGVTNLTRYTASLKQLGIYSLYIEDSISDGIASEEIVSEKTLVACRKLLQTSFDNFQKSGTVEDTALTTAAELILDELLCREDILVSLDSIGTTDASTLSHSINVTVYSLILGTKLGYPRSSLRVLAEGAMLHDIGKTVLNQDILFKEGPLTDEEFHHVREHATLGYELLKKNNYMSEVSKIIALSHHERMDGSGYPLGIANKSIHKFARIVAIADIYDALTMDRCYRSSWPVIDAVKELEKEAIHKLDRDFVATFVSQLAIYPNGSFVRLSDDRFGIVKAQNNQMPFHPIVRVLVESDGTHVVPYEIDLLYIAVKIKKVEDTLP